MGLVGYKVKSFLYVGCIFIRSLIEQKMKNFSNIQMCNVTVSSSETNKRLLSGYEPFCKE